MIPDGVSEKQPCCRKCGKTLTYDEIGIHKKMINRGATEFFCLACLAAYEPSLNHGRSLIDPRQSSTIT